MCVFSVDVLHVCLLGAAADLATVTAEIENEGHQEP